MALTLAILAGGESRRMGADKAALTLGGETLLARTARIAGEAGLAVLVVGRARPNGWGLDRTRFVPDDAPGQGPLGALVTALRLAQGPVLALACDLPLLSSDALRWLLSQPTGPLGLAAVNGGRLEPLFTVYTLACLARAESRLADGRRSLHGLIEEGGFARATAPGWVAACLVNVNTPDEWARLTGTGSETGAAKTDRGRTTE